MYRIPVISTVVPMMLASSAFAAVLPSYQSNSSWYTEGEAAVMKKTEQTTSTKAKNVILFVGDGMGISTLTAARILEGQQKGNSGEENFLSFEKFPFSAFVKTYNTNQQTPDSAGTMTAMMSGVKSKAGVIGVSSKSLRKDCADYLKNGEDLYTALEWAEYQGKATGVVSTARITHATPAATYAKSAERGWEDDGDFKNGEAALGCVDIARQLVEFESRLEARLGDKAEDAAEKIDGIDVVFGGGRRSFFQNDPADISGFAERAGEGDRKDGRNLIQEWQNNGGTYVMDQTGFDALDLNSSAPVLGLFNESHMRYEANRSEDVGGEPSLSEMTEAAIAKLDNDKDGFFLMVESGRIDHGHHAGSAYNALTDAIEFSKAVQAAVNNTNADETLIIVTADHSHVFTIAGYPTRGNPILGKVVGNNSNGEAQSTATLALDNMPYTTLGYTNGLGHFDLGNETNADVSYTQAETNGPQTGRSVDLTGINTESSGFHQQALVPTSSETHAGEDIAVHAMGPSAHLFQGTIEQSVIYHVMMSAMNASN